MNCNCNNMGFVKCFPTKNYALEFKRFFLNFNILKCFLKEYAIES